MSDKSLLGVRGNGKPVTTFLNQIGQRNGKAVDQVVLEMYDEMSVYPPATKEEVQAFLRVQSKRCNMNLANAKDRGDKRAVANLTRKAAIYEYLIRIVETLSLSVNEIKSDSIAAEVPPVCGDGACPIDFSNPATGKNIKLNFDNGEAVTKDLEQGVHVNPVPYGVAQSRLMENISKTLAPTERREGYSECRVCRVHSVDIFGHCHVCGKNW